MQINKVDNISYKGMYRLPNKPGYIDEVLKNVLPVYTTIRKEPVFMFSGNNPFVLGLRLLMKDVAAENGSSVDWLKKNANNHGINLTDIGSETLHIITTEGDTKLLEDFIKEKLVLPKETFIEKIKRLFLNQVKETEDTSKKLPQHLKLMNEVIKINNKFAEDYKIFSKDEIPAKDPKDLLKLMMSEIIQ